MKRCPLSYSAFACAPAAMVRRSTKPCWIEVIAGKLFIKGLSRDSEQSAGSNDISPSGIERFGDDHPLVFANAQSQRPGSCVRFHCRNLARQIQHRAESVASQFTVVARPFILEQALAIGSIQIEFLTTCLFQSFTNKPCEQRGYVFAAVSQGRDLDTNRTNAIRKVFADSAIREVSV